MAHTATYPQSAFAGWLLILAWAPLPLASNRPWALALLAGLCALLALLMVAQSFLRGIDVLAKLHPYRVPLALWLCVPLWASVQALPLPVTLLDTLAPATASLHRALGAATGTISLDPGRTQLLATWSWALWFCFVMSLLLLDTRARVRTAAMLVVYCAVFQALYGSFMTLSGLEYGFFVEKDSYRGVATGTFVNRNHLAGYLEMALAIGVGMLVATLSRGQAHSWRTSARRLLDSLLGSKVRLRVFLALMVVALVLTRSRMGNTAFFGSLIATGLILMLLQRRLHKGALVLFLSLILVDILIVGQWFGFDQVVERMQNTAAQTETRDEVVRDTLTMIQARPLAGTGLGSYATAFSEYQQADVAGYYDHTHNDYLQFASELGLLGLLPLGALVLLSLARALYTLHSRHDRLARGLAFAATMGILALMIHSFVDFNLQMPANAQLFALVLAFAWISGTLPRDSAAAPVQQERADASTRPRPGLSWVQGSEQV